MPDLGQHLLVDEAVISRVVKAAAIIPGDHVLDAGAGTGALTRPLADAVSPDGKVWAVDVDPAMVKALTEISSECVQVVEGDLLDWPLPETLTAVVANPPYKIAAPIIEKAVAAGVARAVYVVPRELADRLCAKVGSELYGKLTIRVRLHAAVEDLGYLPRKAFDPQPAVTSGIIRLRARKNVQPYDSEMLGVVLDAAWDAWNRKARHAFAHLAPRFRTDGAALAHLLKQSGWSDLKTCMLPPDAFATVARHLSAGRQDAE